VPSVKSREISVNRLPVSQAALEWLRRVDHPDHQPDPQLWYVPQLAWWGLDQDPEAVAEARPLAWDLPDREALERHVLEMLYPHPGLPAEVLGRQSLRFLLLTNLALPTGEQESSLEMSLRLAKSPQEAAQAVLEVLSERVQQMHPAV
jgi:hypothetical protein